MIEGTVEHFLKEVGRAKFDYTLALDDDGTTGRAKAIANIDTAHMSVMRRLLADGVSPQMLARKATLTQDSTDEYVYYLPPRTLAVLTVEDSDEVQYPSVYSRTRMYTSGYMIDRRAVTTGANYAPVVLFYNITPGSGGVYAWVLEEPARMSYGDGTYASTTITLEASPDIGDTIETDDYYNGVDVAVVSGTYSGQIRQISDYVGSTRVATVTAWANNPSASDKYSTISQLPRVTWRAITMLAARNLLRIDRKLDPQADMVASETERSYREALAILLKPVTSASERARNVSYWLH